jgi:hypothetical protein
MDQLKNPKEVEEDKRNQHKKIWSKNI